MNSEWRKNSVPFYRYEETLLRDLPPLSYRINWTSPLPAKFKSTCPTSYSGYFRTSEDQRNRRHVRLLGFHNDWKLVNMSKAAQGNGQGTNWCNYIQQVLTKFGFLPISLNNKLDYSKLYLSKKKTKIGLNHTLLGCYRSHLYPSHLTSGHAPLKNEQSETATSIIYNTGPSYCSCVHRDYLREIIQGLGGGKKNLKPLYISRIAQTQIFLFFLFVSSPIFTRNKVFSEKYSSIRIYSFT